MKSARDYWAIFKDEFKEAWSLALVASVVILGTIAVVVVLAAAVVGLINVTWFVINHYGWIGLIVELFALLLTAVLVLTTIETWIRCR